MTVNRGVSGPGCVPGPGGVPGLAGAWSWGVWSRGVSGPRGCLVLGGSALGVCSGGVGIPACTEADSPRERRLLLRTLRILLECILVLMYVI